MGATGKHVRVRSKSPVRRLSGRGRLRVVVTAGAALTLLAGTALVVAPAARADGPTTFANTTQITIPQIGQASPYASDVTVSGMGGLVSHVSVNLSSFTHAIVQDVDILLVAPSGQNLVILSDVGGSGGFGVSNATLTLDDSAASSVPSTAFSSGTYRPTNYGSGDTFPVPAPSPSSDTTFAGAFSGIAPNGTWHLYVVDDTDGDTGSISGGWSLSLTTDTASAATTTTLTSSVNPSATGSSVTFTATVLAGADPVTTGSVQFKDGATSIGGPVALNGSGQATLTTSSLAEGTHSISASYSGAAGFLTSSGTVTQQVDNATTVNGNTFCNTGPISIPDHGTASVYPSHVTVSGLTGTVSKVTATLNGLSHTSAPDVDVLLSGPQPTTNVTLLSDAGGSSGVSGATVTFDDDAASTVGSPLTSGTYRPTDDDSQGADVFPSPAPAETGTSLAPFAGSSPNGTYSLWVVDDATGDSGSISGGWCLTVTSTVSTSTVLTSSSNPSSVGDSVTFTATVTAGADPVGSGSVQFSDGGSPLGSPVPVAADGTATFTTSALSAGTHTMTAAYSGLGFATSQDSLDQVVSLVSTSTVLVSSLNPSSVGDSVTFTATVTAGADPVGSGSVQFSDGGSPLGSPVPIAADGTASLTTSVLSAGTHTMEAAFTGAGYSASSGTVSQVVVGTGQLTLVKLVTNDNGGMGFPTQWTLKASGPVSISGSSGSAAVTGAVVPAGTYVLSESGPGGYASSGWSCTAGTLVGSSLTIGVGESATCSVGNDDEPATLTLAKKVVNDSGGSAPEDAWTLKADGPTPISGSSGSAAVTGAAVNAGVYELSEFGGPAGYALDGWSCTGGSLVGSKLTIENGATVSCTATNNDLGASLTLVKFVTNDNGGTALPSQWTLKAGGPSTIEGATGSAGVTGAIVPAGTYVLSESGGPAGYSAGEWLCTGGSLSGSSLTIAVGSSVTCSITNDDQPAHLTLVKHVVNNSGGWAQASAWTLKAAGPSTISGATGSAAVTGALVQAGTYDLSESGGPAGYTASAWTCTGAPVSGAMVKVPVGANVVCSITNDDQAAHLTLVKRVTNNSGGWAQATAWTLKAAGPVTISGATGSPAVTGAKVPKGTYKLSEFGGPLLYTASHWVCTGGSVSGAYVSVPLGGSVVCTIVNDDQPQGHLTLVKRVVNNDGGTASPAAWKLRATGPSSISGVSGSPAVTKVAVRSGSYALSQYGPAGYLTYAWTCVGATVHNGVIWVGQGKSVVCTSVSDDKRHTH